MIISLLGDLTSSTFLNMLFFAISIDFLHVGVGVAVLFVSFTTNLTLVASKQDK